MFFSGAALKFSGFSRRVFRTELTPRRKLCFVAEIHATLKTFMRESGFSSARSSMRFFRRLRIEAHCAAPAKKGVKTRFIKRLNTCSSRHALLPRPACHKQRWNRNQRIRLKACARALRPAPQRFTRQHRICFERRRSISFFDSQSAPPHSLKRGALAVYLNRSRTGSV